MSPCLKALGHWERLTDFCEIIAKKALRKGNPILLETPALAVLKMRGEVASPLMLLGHDPQKPEPVLQ